MIEPEVDAGDRAVRARRRPHRRRRLGRGRSRVRLRLHVASPFPPEQPKDPDELIVPAREGRLRVLRAALDAGVERVVLTSSAVAVPTAAGRRHRRGVHRGGLERPRRPDADALRRSKTIAERAAWDLVRERGRRGAGSRRQPRRDPRPGAQRRPLLLPAGGRAAAGRHARHAEDRLQLRRRARCRRSAHPGDDRPEAAASASSAADRFLW